MSEQTLTLNNRLTRDIYEKCIIFKISDKHRTGSWFSAWKMEEQEISIHVSFTVHNQSCLQYSLFL